MSTRIPLPRMTFKERYEKFLDIEATISYRLDQPRTRESFEAIELLRGTQMALVDAELNRIAYASCEGVTYD